MHVASTPVLSDVPLSKVTAADTFGGSACTDCSGEPVQFARVRSCPGTQRARAARFSAAKKEETGRKGIGRRFERKAKTW